MRARLMTAIVVALVTLFGALAAAAATVEFIGGVADGRGSLVIKSPRVLPFASDQVGRGLILAFDDQVRGDPAAAGAALAGFVDKIKLEDGGATVIVTLTADRRARVRRARHRYCRRDFRRRRRRRQTGCRHTDDPGAGRAAQEL